MIPYDENDLRKIIVPIIITAMDTRESPQAIANIIADAMIRIIMEDRGIAYAQE